MGFIFKGILAVIWLLVVPCLAGGFYFRREKRTCGEYLLDVYKRQPYDSDSVI